MKSSKNYDPKLLRTIGVLESMDDAGIAHLASVSEMQEFEIAETIVSAHDEPEHIYFIVGGSVQIQLPGKGFVKLEAGTFFGEGGLVEGEYFLPPGWRIRTRNATIVAFEAAKLVAVQFDQFGFAVQKYPAVRSAISDESKRRGGH